MLFNQTVFLFGLAFVVFRALQFRYRYNRSWDYLDATLRRFGLIAAGFAVPVSFTLAAFYARGLLSELLYYTVYLPLFTYSPPFTVRGRLLAFLSFLLVWLLAIGMIVRVGVSLVRGRHLEPPIRSSRGQLYRDGGSYRGRNGILFVALGALFVSYPGVRGFNAQHQPLFVFPPVALLAVGELRRLLDATWQHLYVNRVSAGTWQSRSPLRHLIVGVLVVCLVISAGFNGVYANNTLSHNIDEQVTSARAVDERVDGVTYTWAPQQSHLYYFSDGIEPAPTFFGPVYSQAMSDQVRRDIEQSEVEYVVVQKSFVDDGEIRAVNSKWFADEKADLVTYLNRQYEPADETDGYVIFRRVES